MVREEGVRGERFLEVCSSVPAEGKDFFHVLCGERFADEFFIDLIR